MNRLMCVLALALFASSATGLAAPQLTMQFVDDTYNKEKKVITKTLQVGERTKFTLKVLETSYEKEATYDVRLRMYQYGTGVRVYYSVGESLRKDGKYVEWNGYKGNLTLKAGESVVVKNLHAKRGRFGLRVVNDRRVSNFFSFTDVNKYTSPMKNYMENRWDFDWEGCSLPGASVDIMACPLVWDMQFAPHLNAASLVKAHNGSNGDELSHSFYPVSKNEAADLMMRRMFEQYEYLVEMAEEEGIEAPSGVLMQDWVNYLGKLDESSQLVYCDEDTYWAISVNSSTCYYVDLVNKKVTRIEHGDTDG
jgi:hypothetical protein